ncbi:MAG: hypothetical protein ACFB9M_11840 [Myxococcota bacterium]
MVESENSNGSDWLERIRNETELLKQLARAAARTRSAALRSSESELSEMLSHQSDLCGKLEVHRLQRSGMLRELGYPPRDFLVAVLDHTPRSSHAETSGAFAAFVTAAEAAQQEIDINKEFFGTALATLEDAVASIGGVAREPYPDQPSPSPKPLLINFSA